MTQYVDAFYTGQGEANVYRIPSAAATTNAASVKTTEGRVYGIQGQVAAAYAVYICLYDTNGVPVPGTTPLKKKIPVAASSVFSISFPFGIQFNSGIGIAITKLAPDADTTVLVIGDVLQLNLDYL